MIILAIGDPHSKTSNINDLQLLAAEILSIVSEKKPDAVVILGDLHDYFERAHLQAWDSMVKFLDKISSVIETYYIIGNHCSINNQIFLTDEHFFNAFKKWQNLTIVDKPSWLEDALLVPYTPPGRFMEALEAGDKWNLANVIFAHQEFFGAKIGPIVSTVGDIWNDDYPLVVSGHIHDRQWVGSNIYYTGTPYQTSFGDTGEKTVALVNTTSKLITEIPIKTVPKRVSLKMSCSEFKNLILSEGNHYRITVSDTSENINNLKKTKQYKDISTRAKIILIPFDVVQVTKKINKTDGYKEILKRYIANESKLVQSLAEEVLK
jgi:DNA repair exonuclease SbcCD nuclease subunit